MRLVLVRHGETEWSRDGRHTGTTDLPLTEHGVTEGERVRPLLADFSFARVLSSPLSRARETCRLAGLADRAEIREELREWDYGKYEGVTTAQIHAKRPRWVLWRDGCPGGEQPADVGARADQLLAELATQPGDVAIFGHGHMLRVLTARWLEQPPSEGARYVLGTATLSVLGWEHDWHTIRTWNSR
ncbi:MAG: histidine phosphatase family protein [Solirubrobacterales bacterium]|nr:histidine phosphatase family protein [Solirubrobacterales bacterium]